MNEIRSILNLRREASQQGAKVALATIVKVKGSSYRKPGAKMLITDTGSIAGAVSGGCLERDLIKRAIIAMNQNQPSILTYDTRSDSEDDDGDSPIRTVSLGCEGIIEIFLNPQADSHLLALGRSLRGPEPSEFRISLPDGTEYSDLLFPPMHVTLFGAGHDAVPMWRLAAELGWESTVVDCRSSFPVPRNLFQGVKQYLVCSPDEAVNLAGIDSRSVVIVMTHNFDHDRILLPHLINRSPFYIGLLGPRKRAERLMHGMGITAAPDRLHFPLGLDIGGYTPQTIALSALSQITAVLNGRTGRFLSREDLR